MRGIVGEVAGLLGVALRSWLCTLLLMLLLGVVLAGASYYLLAGLHWAYAGIAAAVALIECVVVGVVLATKRAIAAALLDGLRRLQLGRATLRLVFGRLLGVSAEQEHGERGGWVVRTVERLPLAQAEKSLDDAVCGIVNAPDTGGGPTSWLRRRIQNRLVGSVQKYTLAHFRDEDARHGGVDLAKVGTDLGERIDGLLVGKLRGSVNLWTAAVLIGLPTQILVTVYIVLALLK